MDYREIIGEKFFFKGCCLDLFPHETQVDACSVNVSCHNESLYHVILEDNLGVTIVFTTRDLLKTFFIRLEHKPGRNHGKSEKIYRVHVRGPLVLMIRSRHVHSSDTPTDIGVGPEREQSHTARDEVVGMGTVAAGVYPLNIRLHIDIYSDPAADFHIRQGYSSPLQELGPGPDPYGYNKKFTGKYRTVLEKYLAHTTLAVTLHLGYRVAQKDLNTAVSESLHRHIGGNCIGDRRQNAFRKFHHGHIVNLM